MPREESGRDNRDRLLKIQFFLILSYMDKVTLCLGLVFKPHFYNFF